jgi:hypothetical protein
MGIGAITGWHLQTMPFMSDVEVADNSLTFILAGKQTDCLAPDKCGLGGCEPNSGCCN